VKTWHFVFNISSWARILAVAGGILAVGIAAFAQSGSMSPYPNEKDGVSAGGRWMEFQSEEPMTGAKRIRFELLSNNYLSEDPDYKPRIELFCTDGKLALSDFNPGVRLAPPDRGSFWGRPQMSVLVRVDDTHQHHAWNWVDARFLAMDKGTTRGLIGAQIFKVEITTRRGGSEIADFSPAGLQLDRVKKACNLTPKKPSND